jgi:hypothetical protein
MGSRVKGPEEFTLSEKPLPGMAGTPTESVAHQCPPDRVAMMARLSEIQASYDTRLANQRQVIENLSEARHALLAANARYESFVRYVASLRPDQIEEARVKAQELLNAQEGH